jgi:transcriptional regulator with PAS, ATPase and Fis domain
MMKKKIALITMDPVTMHALSGQLTNLLRETVDIESYCLEETINQHIDAQIAVISNYYLNAEVKRKFTFAERTIVLNARRSIGKQGIKRLLSLPSGKRGVLYISQYDLSCHMINSIKQSGITQIELLPEQGEDADFVITAGQKYPQNIQCPIVDIGILTLDISTIIEILVLLDLTDIASTVSAKYGSDIIELCKEVTIALDKTTQANKTLEVVLNSHFDGIVMLDDHGKILVCNVNAEKLFSQSQTKLAGMTFNKDNGFPWEWSELDKISGNIVSFKHFKLMVEANPVLTPSGKAGTLLTFRDVTEFQRLEEMVRKDRALKGLEAHFYFKNIIGASPRIISAITISRKLAQTEATILIYGETGVGKELFAQAIHNASLRKNGPFLGVNFSAVSESLMESELFGYEEGSFTGAKKGGKAGLFEMAYGGTIFLDEIGDASPALQNRLLRVLQEKQIRRVGGTKIIPIDVRVIAATNKNLPELIKRGLFREDLYYRLNVLPLNIPPLREREEDIIVLIQHFLNKKGYFNRFTAEAWEALLTYSWPGNIRELMNAAEYICCTVELNENIDVTSLPENILASYYNVSPDKMTFREDTQKDTRLPKHFLRKEKYAELILVLQEIRKILRANGSVGRRSLTKNIPGMSEARIRENLKLLKNLGYVTIGPRRKGTSITENGKKLLDISGEH